MARPRPPSQQALNALPAGVPDPTLCVFRHVTRTSRAAVSAYDAALVPAGLTAGQFNLMMTLHLAGSNSVGELAKLAAMDASTVPRAIRPLIDKALVDVRVGEDRRRRIVNLTAAGRRTLLRAAPIWAEAQQAVISQFGNNNWPTLIAALARLRAVLRRHGG